MTGRGLDTYPPLEPRVGQLHSTHTVERGETFVPVGNVIVVPRSKRKWVLGRQKQRSLSHVGRGFLYFSWAPLRARSQLPGPLGAGWSRLVPSAASPRLVYVMVAGS